MLSWRTTGKRSLMETGWHASSYFRSFPLHQCLGSPNTDLKSPGLRYEEASDCPLLRQGYYVEMGKESFGEDNTSFQLLIAWFLSSYFKTGHWFIFNGHFTGWVGAGISVGRDSPASVGRQVQRHCLGCLLATSLREKHPFSPLIAKTPLKFINKP